MPLPSQAVAPSLEVLAAEHFDALTGAERRLLAAAPTGKWARCGSENPVSPENDPATAENWSGDRTIRTALLRWLCLDPGARELVAPVGVRVFAARFDLRVDLSYIAVPFPLSLHSCWFPEGINIERAQFPELILSESRIDPYKSMAGTVEVKTAILADGLRVGGLLKLSDACIDGGVRLFAASIGSTLECERTRMRNAGAVALNGEGATTGSLHLRDRFESDGTVLLRNAKIHGNLDCHDGHFRNSANSVAVVLDAEGAQIDGTVFLRAGFVAAGGVRLVAAEIAHGLDVADAEFVAGKEAGLFSSQAKIKGSVRLDRVAAGDDTWFLFEGASCEILDDDPAGWAKAGHMLLDGFTYARLERPGTAQQRLAWLRRQVPTLQELREPAFRPQPYRQLAQVLRAQGHEAEALDVLVGMARDRLKYARLGHWSRFWSWILWHLIGGGYRPLRAAGWLIVLWLANALIFNAAFDAGLIGPTDQKAYETFAANEGRIPDWHPQFRPVVFAIDVSLPIISLGERDKWRPLARSIFARTHSPDWVPDAVSIWRWMAIALGWFLASMLVAGVTGLVAKN